MTRSDSPRVSSTISTTMSTLTTSQGTSISCHLHAAKKILQDVTFDARIATTLDEAQFGALEQDVFETLRLIRSWRNNKNAPINRIPPEILSLLPDFWCGWSKDQDTITLTHVCRAWRKLFVSRASLWTNLDCANLEKTRVYLERSKSSPIHLSLYRHGCLDPFIEIIPHTIERLKSLGFDPMAGGLQRITAHLSRPTPLLEELTINGGNDLVLPPTLFNGDLSSLRRLHLEYVRTELPWRNMANLTSFLLVHTSPISVGQVLDFFESAPHLREVTLYFPTPTTGDRHGRLVPLACLKRMYASSLLSSFLFDHLLIPVGARLTMEVDLPIPSAERRPPKFFDNLRNLPDFTVIKLTDDPCMQFSGPNGEVFMAPRVKDTCLVLDSLAYFDTSKTERLEIKCGESPNSDSLYRALLPMKNLRTLVLTRCIDPHIFVQALHPSMGPSGAVVCPELEELIIEHRGMFEIKVVVGAAAARASRGVKLKTVRIVSWYKGMQAQLDVSELKKHVLHVESQCTQQ